MTIKAALLHEIACTPTTKSIKDPQRSKFNGYRAGLQRVVTSWDDLNAVPLAAKVDQGELEKNFALVLQSVINGLPEGANDNNKAYWEGYRNGLTFAMKKMGVA